MNKNMTLLILVWVLLCSCYAGVDLPVTSPIIDTGNCEYSFVLTGNRSIDKADIVCADSTNVYLTVNPTSVLCLRIPRSQIVKISPELPAVQYLSEESARYLLPSYLMSNSYNRNDSYSANASEHPALYKAESASMIAQLKPTHKYIVSARILDVDSYGGVDNVIFLTNLSQKRIKYATFSVGYYNRVGDRVSDDIRGFTTLTCKLTGYVEPGQKAPGNWGGFYNTSAISIKMLSVTLIFSNGESLVLSKKDPALLVMEN